MSLVRLQGPVEIGAVWQHARPLVLDAIDGTMVQERELLDSVIAGKQQMWCAFEGEDIWSVGFTNLVMFPSRKACFVDPAACKQGRLEAMLGCLEEIAAWAKKEGCTDMHIVGRHGWKKVLPEPWQARRTIYERELSNG